MLIRQTQDLRQQPTAHLAQTMSFLQQSTQELEATLLKELQENPALELVEEMRCPQCRRRIASRPCPHCTSQIGQGEAVVVVSPREFTRQTRSDEDFDWPEIGAPARLDEHLLRQVGPALQPDERRLAAYILARLDDDGLLPESPAEVAIYNRASLGAVERVLSLIQHADPPGCGAQSPQQSLLLQLDGLADSASAEVLDLARAILQAHFSLLAKREYGRIAHRLRVPRARVAAVASFIQRNLTPYPARAFWGDGRLPGGADDTAFRNPDVNIACAGRAALDGPLMIEVFAPLAGWLRVNPEFKAALDDCQPDEREKWTPVVERAKLITKCVQQRNHTMRRLMEILAHTQRAFILGGDGDLKPITRSRVARELGVHESTISRAVHGKCAALPDGRIVPLSRFFDRSLSARDRVRALIESEARPLTDDEIAEKLGQEGTPVARRTVAKYRNMLGILPAHLRARQLAPTPAT